MERRKLKLRTQTVGESAGENKPSPEDGHRPQRAFKMNPNTTRTALGSAVIGGSQIAMQPKLKPKVSPTGLASPEMVFLEETPSM